jgi:1,2-diacylglycerol 3-beta-glucosyltransferase
MGMPIKSIRRVSEWLTPIHIASPGVTVQFGGTVARLPVMAALATTAYEVGLLAAAAADRGRPAAPGELPSLAVIIPAHDEEAGLTSTIAALQEAEYATRRAEVIVIADNCSDRTADVAREAGATVWERRAPGARGKGQALCWAVEQLDRERPDVAAVAFVDADCIVSKNFLTAVGAALAAGADAVQTDYVVAAPEEDVGVALRYAAFRVMNTMRPRGKTRLGLSAGLLGTGMAFSRVTLRSVGWKAGSIVEDREQHLLLVAAGRYVRFLPEASVTSRMPSGAAADRQEARWEGGRVEIVKRHAGPMLAQGVRDRDVRLIHAVIDDLVPPRSMVVAAAGMGFVAGRRGVALAAATYVGQAVVVIGSLVISRAPRSVYRALPAAPAFVARRVRLLRSIATEGAPSAWERTQREHAPG